MAHPDIVNHDHQQAWLSRKFGLVLIIFQLIVLGLFCGAVEYADGAVSDTNGVVGDSNSDVGDRYSFFQDVHVMIFVGFGFLMTFLRKYGFTAVGLNFLLACMCIQWGILVSGFWHNIHTGKWEKIHLGIIDLIAGDFAAGAVLITYGSILGRTSPLQLIVVAIIEVLVWGLNEMIGAQELVAVDMGGSIFVHAFGAYFGLAVSMMIGPSQKVKQDYPTGHPRNESSNTSDIFAMIGTLFLWMFWPSFNGALASGAAQHRVVVNTVMALSACCVSAFATSTLLRSHRKFDMVDIQNATLAGGVAVGSASDLVIQPWGALIIGIVAGFLSVYGYSVITPLLENKIGLLDTCGVHNLHGMPGILGAVAGSISSALAGSSAYGDSIGHIFPERAPSDPVLAASLGLEPGSDRSASEQAGVQILALLITLGLAIVCGSLTGLLIRQPMFHPPTSHVCYSDILYWEVDPEDDDTGIEISKPNKTNVGDEEMVDASTRMN